MLVERFFVFFGSFADLVFSLSEFSQGIVAKISVDPFGRFDRIPAIPLMAGETQCFSVKAEKPGGLVPSRKDMRAMKSLSPSLRINFSTFLACPVIANSDQV